ncbi:MAG: twin-arginine translocation signal domain-containing protein, partial [Myxococcota bacterium]
MERREFLKAVGMAGGIAALGCQHGGARAEAEAPAQPTPVVPPPAIGTESREAWGELLALLADADTRYLGKDWEIERAGDIADGHRFLMHVLHSGMEQWLESDP